MNSPISTRHSIFEFVSFTMLDMNASLNGAFKIDIETCDAFGGAVDLIACIENPVVIKNILANMRGKEPERLVSQLPARPEPRTRYNLWN